MRATLLVALLLVACSSSKSAPGELMIAIDTDMTPGVDFDRLAIDVKVGGQTLHSDVFNELGLPGLRQFPLTYAVVSNGDPTLEVQLRVSTGRSDQGSGTPVGAPKTLSEQVTTIPTNRTAMVRMPVQWLCVGSGREQGGYVEGNCPEGTTCVAGDCVDWRLAADQLETFDEKKVFGGGSGRGEGACFDTLSCFESGYLANVDRSACAIDAPSGGGAGVNVALVGRPGDGGICGNGFCLVPLPGESSAGWYSAGKSIALPASLCKGGVLGGRALGVAVTTACATRTDATPTCGPWSVIKKSGTLDAGAPDGTPLDVPPLTDAAADR